MATKPKINPVALFFIIIIVAEIFLTVIWFVRVVMSEPASESQNPTDEATLFDQNIYYKIVNTNIAADSQATADATLKSPFEVLK